MRYFLIALLLMLATGCADTNSGNENNNLKDTGQTGGKPRDHSIFSSCYMKISGRDTVILQLRQNDGSVSGELKFDNYQIDGSRGIVSGIVEKDTVKLWYDFNSEGMHSVMEIYFIQRGDGLLRGYGPMDVKGDTSYFTKYSEIIYSDNDLFSKVNCLDVVFLRNFPH